MAGDLVELARFPSSTEAAMVRNHLESEGIDAQLDGEAMASWFSHLGSAIGGVRLLVGQVDAPRAREILDEANSSVETEASFFDEEDEDSDHTEEQEAELPERLMHAWRASMLGFFLFPPLLSLYSTWLLIRHGLLLEKEERPVNWRAGVAMLANVTVFGIVAWFTWLATGGSEYLPQHPSIEYIEIDGKRIEPKHVEKTITINMVPGDVLQTKTEE